MNESATVLLTVTNPQEVPLKDYTILFEAISLEDSQMTASLELIASSKSELVVEDMTVNCEGEDTILTAFISNVGLMDAKNVKVQFFNGSPSVNNLLGEQLINISSGELIVLPIHCSLSDGIYTFHAVIDPDNSIFESCEFNNELSIGWLLDRTPPEAEIFFDPHCKDLTVRGIDNLDSSVDISATEEATNDKNIRIYTLTDDTGNMTELQIEIKHHNRQIKAKIINIQYNDNLVPLLKNSFKIGYTIKNGEVKMLNQFFIIGNTEVHLIYNGNKDRTKIIINETEKTAEGLSLVVIRTHKGDFLFSYRTFIWC